MHNFITNYTTRRLLSRLSWSIRIFYDRHKMIMYRLYTSQIARFKGQHEAILGPTGPRWTMLAPRTLLSGILHRLLLIYKTLSVVWYLFVYWFNAYGQLWKVINILLIVFRLSDLLFSVCIGMFSKLREIYAWVSVAPELDNSNGMTGITYTQIHFTKTW